MKLLWIVAVVVIAVVNWYYIESFHAVASQLRDLRVSLARSPYEPNIDPAVRLTSAFTKLNQRGGGEGGDKEGRRKTVDVARD